MARKSNYAHVVCLKSLFQNFVFSALLMVPSALYASNSAELFTQQCLANRSAERCSQELTWASNYCRFASNFSLRVFYLFHPDPQTYDYAVTRARGIEIIGAMRSIVSVDRRRLNAGPLSSELLLGILDDVEAIPYAETTGENVLMRGAFQSKWFDYCLLSRL